MNADEEAKLRGEYNAALRPLKDCVAGKVQGVEMRYGLAYQALVKAGYEPPLKRKYRGL